MRKLFIFILFIVSFFAGVVCMYIINERLSYDRSLAFYVRANKLMSEKQYSKALLSACDSASRNNEDYSPLVVIADILSIDGESKEISREIYKIALDIARKSNKKERIYDIQKLQKVIGASSLDEAQRNPG